MKGHLVDGATADVACHTAAHVSASPNPSMGRRSKHWITRRCPLLSPTYIPGLKKHSQPAPKKGTWTVARPRRFVGHERLVRLGQAQLPGQAGALDAGPLGGACAAVVAADEHVVRVPLTTPAATTPTPFSLTSFTDTRAPAPPRAPPGQARKPSSEKHPSRGEHMQGAQAGADRGECIGFCGRQTTTYPAGVREMQKTHWCGATTAKKTCPPGVALRAFWI